MLIVSFGQVEKYAQLIVSDLSLQALLSEVEFLHAKKRVSSRLPL